MDYFSGSQALLPELMGQVKDLPDDSSVFEDENNEEEIEGPTEPIAQDFYANLAEGIESSRLATLAANLLDGIKEDKESRSEWEEGCKRGLRYLGIKIEEVGKLPFKDACPAFDSTLLKALIRGYSTARAELFPAAGPAKIEITGKSTRQVEEQGERVKDFMNYYLTQEDEDYYTDSEQLILYTDFFGTAFRKVYQDPQTNYPIARLVKPEDLIVNLHATSLLSSSRITHVTYLTKKEIIQNEISGEFLKGTLPLVNDENDDDSSIKEAVQNMEGTDTKSTENKNLFTYYETHCELDDAELHGRDVEIEEENDDRRLPKPYIVKISKDTRKIVSIKRNWQEGDEKYRRKECFIRYTYLPFFGMYGLGLLHLLGSNANVLTSILRQLIDAGALKSFPGGLKDKAFRAENNDRVPGPGQFLEVECNDRPIQEGIMMMPYAEPSSALLQLRNELISQTADVASTADSEVPEVGNNAPVGTTLAMLEVANKIQSSVLRSMRKSLGKELKLLAKLFGECLPDSPYPFSVPGGDQVIMRADFNNFISIVPVSDPNVLTTTHRLIAAEALLKTSQQNPEIHNMKEIYRLMYGAMDVEDIDKILVEDPKPVSLDPLSENAYLALNKPIMVSLFQADDAHILAHQQLEQDPLAQQNPQTILQMRLHIQLHKAAKALKQMIEHKQQELMNDKQQLMEQVQTRLLVLPIEIGKRLQIQKMQEEHLSQLQNMPIEKALEIPEIQNLVAANDATEIQQKIQQQQQQQEEEKQRMLAQQENQVDKQVALAEIAQRREQAQLKREEAELKAETEGFKTQSKFESDMAKLEAQQEMAKEKNETNLELAEMKQSPPQIIE